MKTIGIVCEYNPFHLGHEKQIRRLREVFPDAALVCLMSGNFVQRGAPAILDKSLRAEAAVLCGADLVLENPVQYALSSAENFADGAVGILAPFCDGLSFGTESGSTEALLETARVLLSPEFSQALRPCLDAGLSFPAARQKALADLGVSGELLSDPNNILAVEYCKAIVRRGASMAPLPMHRQGSYHASEPDPENPSATALRNRMLTGSPWEAFVPAPAAAVFSRAPLHSFQAGQRAVLARLRSMTEADFAQLPYGSEGLWRKLMHSVRQCSTVEEIAVSVKSRRYTRTRIDRMILCGFLGLTQKDLETPAPYTRVLAFSDRGRAVLKTARSSGVFLNAGQVSDHPFQETERRLGDLYELFRVDTPGAPGAEAARRIYYHRTGV